MLDCSMGLPPKFDSLLPHKGAVMQHTADIMADVASESLFWFRLGNMCMSVLKILKHDDFLSLSSRTLTTTLAWEAGRRCGWRYFGTGGS